MDYIYTRKHNQESNALLVKLAEDYYFHFELDDREADVLSESKEFAENYDGDKDKSLIASCQTRIEFWGDEDADMDYFNDSLHLLSALQDAIPDILIFDFQQGIFFDEM